MSQIILRLDSQQLNAWQVCEEYYRNSFVHQLEPNIEKTALSKGKDVHNLLYLYYLCKIKKLTFEQAIRYGMSYLKLRGRRMDAGTFPLLLQKYAEYAALYRSEKIQPLAVEKGFSKILWENKDYCFIYEGRIDLIFSFEKFTTRLSWMDHKSESRMEELNPNSNQFLGYSWALNSASGIINYFGLQASKGTDSFRRTLVNHKRDVIQEWRDTTIHYYFRILGAMQHGIYLKNRAKCKPYACSPCIFHELCNQTKQGAKEAVIKADFRVRENPWTAWD